MRIARRASLVLLFLWTTPLGAQLAPATMIPWHGLYVGAEIQVNTSTTAAQKRPAVASGFDGNFLAVWHSDHPGMGFGIYGQLFGRDGEQIGSEFQIDQAGPGRTQYTPDVASDGDGNYFVVWTDFDASVTNSEGWLRRYNAVGVALGDAVLVNLHTTGKQRGFRGDATNSGGFTVVWEDQRDGNQWDVYARQFDPAGNGGPELLVNSTTIGNQDRPSVATNDDGFTVIFRNDMDLEARDFDTSGAPLGLQYPVFIGSGTGTGDVVRLGATGANKFFAGASNGHILGRLNLGNTFPIADGSTGAASNPRLGRSWNDLSICVTYTRHGRNPDDPTTADVFGRLYRFGSTGGVSENGTEHQVNTYVDGDQWTSDVAVGRFGELRFVWQSGFLDGSPGQDGDDYSVWSRSARDPQAVGWDVDTLPSGETSNLNGLWEIGERAKFRAKIENRYLSPRAKMRGTLNIPPPPPAVRAAASPSAVVVDDSTADWGTVPGNTLADCHDATGDCYEATVTGPRPGPHWDETLVETLSTGAQKLWLLHIGQSFADVPTTNLFYAFIENIFHNGVTAGGACGGYCPTDGVKRQQMAVFLLKSRYGPSFVPPPATGTIFTDVPITNPFAAWIEALYLLGITGGCSGGPPPAPTQFCPDAIVNRQQMAVFLLKTLEGSTYVPPAAAGIFQDVPLANPFVTWIEELYSRQVTGGCVANPLQYCPLNQTNRQQMAAFLVKTFGLLLYGP